VADLSFASVVAEDAGDGYLHHRLAMYVNIRLSHTLDHAVRLGKIGPHLVDVDPARPF
jgi:deoxyribodipyrimidine photolyase